MWSKCLNSSCDYHWKLEIGQVPPTCLVLNTAWRLSPLPCLCWQWLAGTVSSAFGFHREQSKTSAFWCISSCRVQKGTEPGSHSSDLGMRHTGSGTRLCHFIHFQWRCLPPSPSPQIPLQPMGRQRQRRARFSCCRHLLGGDELHALQAYFSLFECKGRLDKLLRWRCLLWEELIPA